MPIIVVPPLTETSGEAYDLAALTLERLSGQPGYTAHNAVIPETPTGAYAVLYWGGGVAYQARLARPASHIRWTFRVVVAGFSAEQVLDAFDLVRDRLTGWRPLPADRSVGLLNEVDSDPPMIRDDTVANDIRYSLTLTYRLSTSRSH